MEKTYDSNKQVNNFTLFLYFCVWFPATGLLNVWEMFFNPSIVSGIDNSKFNHGGLLS